MCIMCPYCLFFFQAEDGIRDLVRSRGLGDVYKRQLLSDTQNDPVKKASVIRDMVESISKISDQIKRELYIKECSSIMDIVSRFCIVLLLKS